MAGGLFFFIFFWTATIFRHEKHFSYLWSVGVLEYWSGVRNINDCSSFPLLQYSTTPSQFINNPTDTRTGVRILDRTFIPIEGTSFLILSANLRAPMKEGTVSSNVANPIRLNAGRKLK